MPDTLSQPLQGWQNFYLLVGTAAATLVGLMFVAITFGSRFITQKDLPALRVYISPTVIHFIYVLGTAAVVAIPTVPRPLLGTLLLVVGLISWGRTLSGVPLMWQAYRRQFIDLHDWAWYLGVPSVSYLLFVGTGIGLLLGARRALDGLALASILLLVAGIRNAWDLVVWMVLRQDESPTRESDGEGPGQDNEATIERQVSPSPRPPREHEDTPASLALPPSSQADVARVIQETGLNPAAFTWALQPSRYALIGPLISVLVHTPTRCFFRFEFTNDASGQNRVSVFSPGPGAQEVKKSAGSWGDQLGHIRIWLGHLR
jgi:hypothetical protein